MPEGPEVRHSHDVLQQFIGMRVRTACPVGGRYASSAPPGHDAWWGDTVWWRSNDVRLLAIEVKGKLMWWRLGEPGADPAACWHLLCTYGMTGGWMTGQSTHPAFMFVLERTDGDPGLVELTFDDVRHFGTLKFTRGMHELERKLASLGPDMLVAPPDELGFAQRILRRPCVTLAEALMDQRTVCGIGNYVKAESLWLARLSPHRIVSDLTTDEIVCLRGAVVTVLAQSYALKGATIKSYADPDGNVGEATSRFACYGRRIDPDGLSIVSEETRDGRNTWWCPERQR